MSLEHYLEELRHDSQPLKHSSLIVLSGLSGIELDVFKRHWGILSAERRRQVLERMVELAEDNLELDFNATFRVCLRDPDPDVREHAIAGLWECDDRSLILPLINLLRWDELERVRAAAAVALGKFAALAVEEKLLPRDVQRVLDALLEVVDGASEPLEVQRRAIEAVARFPLERVTQIIQRAYESDDPLQRRSAIHAMGKSCDFAWLPTILSELESSDATMRYEVASACGEIGEQSAIPHLAQLLSDDDQQVQLAAIQALGLIGGRNTRRLLQGYLKVADEALVEAMEEALQRIGDEE